MEKFLVPPLGLETNWEVNGHPASNQLPHKINVFGSLG